MSALSRPSTAPGVGELLGLDGERACEVAHDAYERAAVGDDAQAWGEVSEADKATMRATVVALIDHIAASGVVVPVAEVRALADQWRTEVADWPTGNPLLRQVYGQHADELRALLAGRAGEGR